MPETTIHSSLGESPETLDLEVVSGTDNFEALATVKTEKKPRVSKLVASIFEPDEGDDSQLYPGELGKKRLVK